MKRNKKTGRIIAICLSAVLLLVGFIAFFAVKWYISVYGNIGFDSVLNTLFGDLGGVQEGIVYAYLKDGLLPGILFAAAAGMILFAQIKRHLVLYLCGKIRICLYPFSSKISAFLSVVLCGALLVSAADEVGLIGYADAAAQQTTIFEDYYVDPATANITFPETKQNLIYILLESMENTYLSKDLGGALEHNLLPELHQLAEENINFSHTDGVGGFRSIAGATWTIGAMVSQTAGIPLKTPASVSGNQYDTGKFLPGATTMMDLLHEQGYYQTLMVGSDAEFGGRENYYSQHGTDYIYDLFTARRDGIVPMGYHVWWGMEDLHLFEYAKEELTKIAAKEQPFAFTMLTVDTHQVGGYVCDKCGSKYEEQYDNVISCSDRQVRDFVEWLRQQDFYENTTIVICGDHATMDGAYISRNVGGNYTRTMYNCIINSKAQTEHTHYRDFAAIDMFPTMLAALGCDIEGERLGLGTNLFSDVPTLSEEMGSAFRAELTKNSTYYLNKFHFG